MPGFFAHARGMVTRLRGAHQMMAPFRLTLAGGTFPHALIRTATISHDGGYQFLHSIGPAIYVYVFGDRIGELLVGGTVFLGCDGGHGFNDVTAFYNQYRIAATGRPLAVAIGALPAFSAFLTGMKVSLDDAENMLGTFSLRLAFFPQSNA